MHPQLALRSENNIYPWVQLFDADGDKIYFRTPVRGGLRLQQFDFGIVRVDGDPDLSNIVEIRVTENVGDDRSETIWCDDLRFVERPDPAKVLIQFDDGSVTDYTRAFPVLEEYGYDAATFVNPGTIGDGSKLSMEQLSELQSSGWDVCSHSFDHPSLIELDETDQREQIRDSKQWLLDHGFERGAEYFAYPYHDYDQTTLDLVSEYHTLGFAGGYPAFAPGGNDLLLQRNSDEDASTARELIDIAVDWRGITQLYYHHISDDFREEFEETISYLHDLESAGVLEVVTPSELNHTS